MCFTCFTCLPALRAHVPYVRTCLRALPSYVPSFFTCLTCPHFLCALHCLVFYMLTCLFFCTCLRAFSSYVPFFFYVPYVPSFILRANVPLFFHVSSFFYKSSFCQVFPIFGVFYVPSPFFKNCGTTQNYLQQAGIRKNEVE